MHNEFSFVWIAAMIGVALLISNLVNHFSSESRTRKRRRKSYGHVVAKAHRPMVRFSVKTR